MSHSYTPPAVPVFTPTSGAVTLPDDGDALLASSVNNAFQPLADRTLIVFSGLYGAYGSRLRCSIQNGGPGAGGVITINPQQAIRSTTRVVGGTLGGTIDIATVLGAATLADTKYFLYGADVAGVLMPIISTDAPDTTIKYRSTNADQAFLTAFSTDGTNTVLNAKHDGDTYSYWEEFQLVAGGAAIVDTTVPIPNVPTFVQHVYVSCVITNTSTTIKPIFQIRPFGATTGYTMTAPLSPDGTLEGIATYQFLLPVSLVAGLLSFVYKATALDPGESTLDVTAQGFVI